jgi:hypothetical protein
MKTAAQKQTEAAQRHDLLLASILSALEHSSDLETSGQTTMDRAEGIL